MLMSIVTIFGALITVAGIILLVKPEIILDLIMNHADNPLMYGVAIVMRLVLGLLMLTYASFSRFPKTLIFIGWIAVIASVIFAWMGRYRFTKMMRWIAVEIRPYGRAGGGFALVFGLFLLYAFL